MEPAEDPRGSGSTSRGFVLQAAGLTFFIEKSRGTALRHNPPNSMPTIPVRDYPPSRTFDSLDGAIRLALVHPHLSAARREADRLRGSAFIDPPRPCRTGGCDLTVT
jgi:hypothetical protein